MTARVHIPWVTLAVATTVIGASVAAWWSVGLPLTADTAVRCGGRDALALHLGQTWRLISAGLLHSDLHHLLWNLLPSLPILVLIERRQGSLTALGLTLGCITYGHGLGALLQGGTSVGFSPALFGLIAGFSIVNARRYPRLARLGTFYLIVGGFASLRFANVDLASHLGGVLAGGFLSFWWSTRRRAGELMLIALMPLMMSYTLTTQATGWSLPDQGLKLQVHPTLSVQVDPTTRCSPDGLVCASVQTKRVARRHDFPAWSDRCAGHLGALGPSRCLTQRPEQLCQLERRGLYEHSVCLRSGSARALSALRSLIQTIELVPPSDQLPTDSLFSNAIRAHRLGDTERAQALYREAMAEAPLDAKRPFLAALLELDFTGDLGAAERLARRATTLDAIHPDGRALLLEIQSKRSP